RAELDIAFQAIAAARIAPRRQPRRPFASNTQRTEIDEAGQVLAQPAQVEVGAGRPFVERARHLHAQKVRITLEMLKYRQSTRPLAGREGNGERLLPYDALSLILALQVRRAQVALPAQAVVVDRVAQMQRQGSRRDSRVFRQVQGVRHQTSQTGE